MSHPKPTVLIRHVHFHAGHPCRRRHRPSMKKVLFPFSINPPIQNLLAGDKCRFCSKNISEKLVRLTKRVKLFKVKFFVALWLPFSNRLKYRHKLQLLDQEFDNQIKVDSDLWQMSNNQKIYNFLARDFQFRAIATLKLK